MTDQQETFAAPKTLRCPDCGAGIGRPHAVGECDVERCSVCGGQFMDGCCPGHNPAESAWTGYWPGAVECFERGWLRADGEPDLNRWAIYCQTGVDGWG